MEYFCYISRTKVDQLFRNISTDVDEWTEKRVTEHDLGTSMGADLSIANIVNLFKGGITYGHKGLIQREKKVKMHYVEKLRKVLLAIAKEGPIRSLAQSITSSKFDSIYYHYTGSFKVETPISQLEKAGSDSIVTIRTEVQSYTLFLDCSLRFFSEGNEPDGTFYTHSGNHRFFSGEIDLQLETVFILLNRADSNLIGTPLYLKLTAEAAQTGITL